MSIEKITNVNQFFKKTVIRMKSLYRCAENNEAITNKLQNMEKLLQYTVAPTNKEAIKLSKKIAKQYVQLEKILEAVAWEANGGEEEEKTGLAAFFAKFSKKSMQNKEKKCLLLIRNMSNNIDRINGLR